MLLIPHLLCLLLGLLALDTVHASPLTEVKLQNETLLALDTVHASPLTEVKLQNETLALDTVHTDVLAEVKLQNENVHAASSAEMQLQQETLVLDILHAASSPEVKLQRGSCPMFWYSFNGRCYKYVATPLSWADAEKNCVSQGANLVSIHSVGEHNFVRDLIKNFDIHERYTWIGMSDIHQEGWWTWSDGCKVGYTMWWSEGPEGGAVQNCAEINWQTKWNDRQCSSAYASVCASRIMCP